MAGSRRCVVGVGLRRVPLPAPERPAPRGARARVGGRRRRAEQLRRRLRGGGLRVDALALRGGQRRRRPEQRLRAGRPLLLLGGGCGLGPAAGALLPSRGRRPPDGPRLRVFQAQARRAPAEARRQPARRRELHVARERRRGRRLRLRRGPRGRAARISGVVRREGAAERRRALRRRDGAPRESGRGPLAASCGRDDFREIWTGETKRRSHRRAR